MRFCTSLALALFCGPSLLIAQSEAPAPYQIYASASFLSNSFNGVPGSQHQLAGWNAGAVFPDWHGLRFKMDFSSYRGTNLNAQQNEITILAGAQYEHALWRERVFAQALVGEGGLPNRSWGPQGLPGNRSAFANLLGGGLDTPLSRKLAIRLEGGIQHTNFSLVDTAGYPFPYRYPGLPTFFGRYSAGLIWSPKPGTPKLTFDGKRPSVESELIVESLNSFGHYHIISATWWSYLNIGGVEYVRHSWGQAFGARMDYVAEILPVVVLKEPAKTDVWGNPIPLSGYTFTTLHGLAITPVGLRMMWRDGKNWKPYLEFKGGMIGFNRKALAYTSTYEDFTLQQSAGIQIRVNDRWDLRGGLGDFHFSNGFLVPVDPGLDEMSYNIGLSYHLKRVTGR